MSAGCAIGWFTASKELNHHKHCFIVLNVKMSRVPTRTGKPEKMGRHFPVREKSGKFEQTGKVRDNHTKYWKTEIN